MKEKFNSSQITAPFASFHRVKHIKLHAHLHHIILPLMMIRIIVYKILNDYRMRVIRKYKLEQAPTSWGL